MYSYEQNRFKNTAGRNEIEGEAVSTVKVSISQLDSPVYQVSACGLVVPGVLPLY